MSDLRDILREEYERSLAEVIDPRALMSLIEEALTQAPTLQEETTKTSSPSKERRERTLRLPIQFPTEISVGQKPSSEDRDVFHAWMSNLPEGDLGTKVKAIEAYIANPPEASVADTLSYLMFLNTFSFMIQEFNASVAGFLWEPFLAAMFGAESVQVPTSEGDIADVKLMIQRGGVLQRVSLKILRAEGAVGGSFRDLVNHFSENPSEPMIYVVIKKYDDDTLMKFYEFPVSQETFFDFIGHPATVRIYRPSEESFQVQEPISVARQAKAVKATKEKGLGWKVEKITPSGSDESLPGRFQLEPGVEYTAHLSYPEKVAGQAGKDKPGANAKHLWGDEEIYSQWYGLYQQLQQGGIAPADFWAAVKGERPHLTPWAPKGARGYQQKEQFEISWSYAPKHAKVDHLGNLDISKEALDNAFAAGSQSIGADLTDLFNALTDLVDNVGRFFLIDCGDPAAEAKKCTASDQKTRTASGQKAIEETGVVQRVVNDKIASQLK
jgi:hypothetical protein